ncbi:MAG: twin-arginine translocase TatA/TatE family subunit [Alphaproteobacteria bacterium]|nr:twin-arginine translocase TatA/TatE family subunit [Alphaproteobacteria bacterium]MCB9930878.1 twin-arginine translocase TatA/TatE family subunit [Alphaproteobacteria bacterium]
MGVSIWQILIVVLIIAVLFGAGRIPRLMGDVAKGIKSFKAGMKDDDEDTAHLNKPAGQVEQKGSSQQKDPAQS